MYMLPYMFPGHLPGDGDIIHPTGAPGGPFTGRPIIPTGTLTILITGDIIVIEWCMRMICIIVIAWFPERFISAGPLHREHDRHQTYNSAQEEGHLNNVHRVNNGLSNVNQEAQHHDPTGSPDKMHREVEPSQVEVRIRENNKKVKRET